jgi:Protein of unknown function (DUF674)
MEKSNDKFALKLLIDKRSNKVLFGEAGKDVVDFIFSLLSLPLGAVAKLLTENAMDGSIQKVYHSLSNLNSTYILSTGNVSSLLNPPLASISNPNTNFLLPPETHQDQRFYLCRYNYCGYVSKEKGVTCPACRNIMDKEAKIVETKSDASVVAVSGENKGYVKGVVTYSVMDDLTVVPMSTISSIVLLNKFQIKDLGSLEEKTVTIDFEEVRY